MPEETMRVDDGQGGESAIDNAPAWSERASDHHKKQVAAYEVTLKQVAESFATIQRSETVVVNHVEDSHSALARVGMVRRHWLTRPENETALGGILVGASFAATDLFSMFVEDGTTRTVCCRTWFFTFAIVGLFFYCDGWRRARIPSPLGYKTLAERLFIDIPAKWWNVLFLSKPKG